MSKKKILLLSDHLMSTSGVATQSRFLVEGLINTGRYSFVQFGGAKKHEDYRTGRVNDDLVIKPVDGFGSRDQIRQALAIERPDALMLFNDPRFFITNVFEAEEEIHQICPIVYWHLWDNPPFPEFNRVLYDSTDLINCINYPTYEMLKDRYPDRTHFIPHTVPPTLYRPLPHEDRVRMREVLLGCHRKDHFIALWVSRNARRKMPSDVIVAWSHFIKEMEVKYGHRKATLIMHTDPLDMEGPNLHHVLEVTDMKGSVVFSNNRVEFSDMNNLYNVADVTCAISCNEGFGLSMLESMMAGVPIIAQKTGGMTRQVINHATGEENGVALDPDVKCLVGSQFVPYIYEDYVSHKTISSAFMKMYEMGPERRHELGLKAHDYACSEFNLSKMIDDWDRTMSDTIDNWRSRYSRWEVRSL